MDSSILIARFIGPVMLLTGISLFVNGDRFSRIFTELSESPGLIFIAGILALVLGIALVTFHNIWVMDWRAFITVYGWLALIGGVVRILFPDVAIKLGRRIMGHAMTIRLLAGLNILIGGFLAWKGFLA
ncbi:MAG: hypothetical protein Kow0032_18990 [Methyloligellaceae bacterium]